MCVNIYCLKNYMLTFLFLIVQICLKMLLSLIKNVFQENKNEKSRVNNFGGIQVDI